MAVLRLAFLRELDQTRDRAVNLDRQAGRLRVVPREALGRDVPPADDLGAPADAEQLGLVTLGEWAQGHAGLRSGHANRPYRSVASWWSRSLRRDPWRRP